MFTTAGPSLSTSVVKSGSWAAGSGAVVEAVRAIGAGFVCAWFDGEQAIRKMGKRTDGTILFIVGLLSINPSLNVLDISSAMQARVKDSETARKFFELARAGFARGRNTYAVEREEGLLGGAENLGSSRLRVSPFFRN